MSRGSKPAVRPRAWIAGVAVVAMVGIVGAAVAWSWPSADGSPSASGTLPERVGRFAASAVSAEFSVTVDWERPPLDDLDSTLVVTERFTGSVAVEIPGRSESTLDNGTYLRGRFFDGADAYLRNAQTFDALVASRWTSRELTALEQTRTFVDRPTFVGDLFAALAGGVVGVPAGGLTPVSYQLGGARALTFLPDLPFSTATVVVWARDSGEPRRVEITAAGPGRLEAELHFERWNAELVLEPPETDALDQTPAIDDLSLGQYSGVSLLQPVTLPDGWTLLEAEMVLGGAGPARNAVPCLHPVLTYGDGNGESLVLEQLPSTCRTFVPAAAQDLIAETTIGWYVVVDDETIRGEIISGRTVVRFTTTLALEEAAATLAAMSPLVLPTTPPTTTTGPTPTTAAASTTVASTTTRPSTTRASTTTTT